jgi:hypothetical protein
MEKIFALITPETTELPSSVKFGTTGTLADWLLMSKGWSKARRTNDEIAAMVEALQSPAIDTWGCKLVPAEWRVVSEAAYLLDLDDVKPYYEGCSSDEYEIRGWVASNVRDLSVKHTLLDMMAEHDKDLTPDVVQAIHQQLDMDG